jgi:hypothetical protein
MTRKEIDPGIACWLDTLRQRGEDRTDLARAAKVEMANLAQQAIDRGDITKAQFGRWLKPPYGDGRHADSFLRRFGTK